MNRKRMLVVLGFCLAAWIGFLPARGLWAPDEDRYAEVAREMKASGHWLVPLLNGELYSQKPPLFFDAVRVASVFSDGVPGWAPKVVSLMAGLMTLLLTGAIGQRLYGDTGGWLAPLVLGSLFKFGWQAQFGQIDMLLAMLVTAQIALGLSVAAENGIRRWRGILGLVLLATLGVLAKGAVGCVLPWLVLVLYFGSQREWKALRRLGLPVVIGGTLALVGLWLAIAGSTAGWRYPTDLLFHQTIQRYLDPWHHHKPVFYYLQVLLADGLPYSLLLLPLGWFLVRENRWRKPEALLPLVWTGVYLLLFSLSSGKRSVYIFPLLPAVALLITWATVQIERGTWPARSFRWALWATAGLAAAGFALAFTRLPLQYESSRGVLAVGALLLVTGCVSAAWLLKQRRAIAAITALAAASLTMMPATVLPAVVQMDAVKVPQQFVELTRPSRRDGGTLGVYPALIASLNFYARAETPVFQKDQRGTAIAFLAKDSRNRLVALAKDWGPPDSSAEVLYEGPIGDDSYLLLRAPEQSVVPPEAGTRLDSEGRVP